MKQQISEYESETGMKSSVSERELTKQIKKMSNQLQQQITVNKTLSAKLMAQEKACLDERRARQDLEKRLSAALTSTAPSGPSSGPSGRGTEGE